MRAQVIGGLPADLVGSLTGLTQGRFPVYAKSTYAGQLDKKGNKVRQGNAAMVVEPDAARRGIEIFSRAKAPVIAVNDGRVVKLGKTKRLGNFVTLQDVYGNTYTYAHLGEVSRTYPAPKDRTMRRGKPAAEPERDARPARRVEHGPPGPQAPDRRQARRAGARARDRRRAHQGAPVRPPGAPRGPHRRRRRPARRDRRRGDPGRPARLQRPATSARRRSRRARA